MAFEFNGVSLDSIYADGAAMQQVYMNGTLIYSAKRLISSDYNFSTDTVYAHLGYSATIDYSFNSTVQYAQSCTIRASTDELAVAVNSSDINMYDGITSTVNRFYESHSGAGIGGMTDFNDACVTWEGDGWIRRRPGWLYSADSSMSVPSGMSLATDGTNLMMSDGSTIWKMVGYSLTVDSSFAAPSGTEDIFWDGADLISVSDTTNLISLHSGFTATIQATYATPNSEAQGICAVSAI